MCTYFDQNILGYLKLYFMKIIGPQNAYSRFPLDVTLQKYVFQSKLALDRIAYNTFKWNFPP